MTTPAEIPAADPVVALRGAGLRVTALERDRLRGPRPVAPVSNGCAMRT